MPGRSEPILRQGNGPKLPTIADRETSWFDASGWHHISFPTPYARDVRTRHKVPWRQLTTFRLQSEDCDRHKLCTLPREVLPRLLAKLVGPLAWDEAPSTPRALREALPDFSERLSKPKPSQQSQQSKQSKQRAASDGRDGRDGRWSACCTQILSAQALATVRFERRPTMPPGTQKPSTAPARLVSMERLAALAEPKRRRSKFERTNSFVKEPAAPATSMKRPKPRQTSPQRQDSSLPERSLSHENKHAKGKPSVPAKNEKSGKGSDGRVKEACPNPTKDQHQLEASSTSKEGLLKPLQICFARPRLMPMGTACRRLGL